jgi:tRNA/rRNA methyltransferase
MFGHLEQLLTQANFYQVPHKKPKMDQNIRNIFTRNALTHQEVQTLRGIFKALAQKKG